jgi:hypothetical protein
VLFRSKKQQACQQIRCPENSVKTRIQQGLVSKNDRQPGETGKVSKNRNQETALIYNAK